MKKKLMAIVLGMAVFVGQVEAGEEFFKPSPIPSPNHTITDITSSIFSSLLDNQFGELLSSTMNFLDVCFGINFDRLSYDDFCNLPKFGAGICGSKASFSLGGFDKLCEAKKREFSDYLSTQANAAVDYAFGNDKLKYASGLLRSEYNLKIDVSKALEDKSATNTYGNYIKDGKMNEVMAIQEYMKTAGAKGKNVNQIKIEDLKVAENLNAYDKAIKETTESQIDRNKELEPNHIAMIAKNSMGSKDGNNKFSLTKTESEFEGKDENGNPKKQTLYEAYETAANIEIDNVLRTSNYKKIAIPTQEYVSRLTPDLRLGAIYQIRKQQAFEVATITKIKDKWYRKRAQAELLITKEKIMAQQFDRKTANDEIEKIANGGK